MGYEPYLLQLLNGLSIAAILILIGFGMGIIFGLMNVVNLAHGEFFMLGAYVAWVVSRAVDSFWPGFLAAPIIVGLLGMALERLFIRRFYATPLVTLLLTWGLSICIRQLVRLTIGPEWRNVVNPLPGCLNLFGILYPTYRVFIVLLAMVVMILIGYLMLRTGFGLRCRAVIQNRQMASALGINIHQIDLLAFALGAGLAGLAGAVMSPLITIHPDMGLAFLADSFIVVIVGGVGRIMGVVAGGLILGAAQAIISFSINPVWSRILFLLIAALVIRVRPQGLLGTLRREG